MPLKKPSSMEECVYFTNRTIELPASLRDERERLVREHANSRATASVLARNSDSQAGHGRAMAWVFRKECPKCKKGFMGKPQKKGGKMDKKADHYICYSCGYQEKNEQVENSLVLNVEYKCPYCGNEGETTTEYKRKNFYGVKAYVFNCQKCGQKIGITQKLKEPKKKSGFADEEDSKK